MRHEFAAGRLSACVLAHGAELCSLRAGGHELIWQAGPVWPRHAPILFPIVGRLEGDHLRHDGRLYPMHQHGFARDIAWEWLARSGDGCRLVLTDTAATRERFPFEFRFELGYSLAGGALAIDFRLRNTGETMLPASIGAHPAFRWPLFEGVAKDDYCIVFDEAEPAPIRRLGAGLLLPDAETTPVLGNTLALSEDLFSRDALILDRPVSRGARLLVPDGRGVRVEWDGFVELGIWSKPGDFVCIEPWHGTASPVGFDGEILDKPGVMLIGPGQTRELAMRIIPAVDG